MLIKNLHQETTCEVQRLQFRQICAILEGVHARNEVSSGGGTITGTKEQKL